MAKHNREKQAEVLRRTQAQRKEQKKDQVLKAIQQILTQKDPLTFANIATVSGCSISYLYKWEDIKAYIHELQSKKETQLNYLEEKIEGPHSLKTLHEVARQRISKLEAEIAELKGKNEILRGHVAEIYELRDECERLRTQLRELNSPASSSNIIPIKAITKETTKASSSQKEEKLNVEPLSVSEILQLIDSIGVKVNPKFKKEIDSYQSNTNIVRLAIEAFQQYRINTHVDNPEGCLLSMIRDRAEPNGQHTHEIPQNLESKEAYNPSKATSSNRQEPLRPIEDVQKELISIDRLQQLSTIFGKRND